MNICTCLLSGLYDSISLTISLHSHGFSVRGDCARTERPFDLPDGTLLRWLSRICGDGDCGCNPYDFDVPCVVSISIPLSEVVLTKWPSGLLSTSCERVHSHRWWLLSCPGSVGFPWELFDLF